MPVLKWVGGKRQLLDNLNKLKPKKFTAYCEPFLGGGAFLFNLQPTVAYVNDINEDLINVYEIIRDDVENLIRELNKFENTSEKFYEIRDWDREKDGYLKRTNLEKAARTLYLNKTCYNGLFRVNNSGEFNSPFGNYKNPNIVNAPTLRAVSNYFRENEIHFTSGDYEEVLDNLPKGSFVYFDPPYDPVSDSANFTGYSRGGFSQDDQIKLREACDTLDAKGIKFMLSNSDTKFIRKQYAKYDIKVVQAKRLINSNSAKRGEVNEVIVRNYE